jgi:hypothetical protein
MADMILPQDEISVPRPESVRRVELVALEASITDPKVIDIRPHLAQASLEVRPPRTEGLRAD